jgi:hypothetical protein
MKLIKSFCRGSRGAVFSKRAPLAAGGKSNFMAVKRKKIETKRGLTFFLKVW